MKHDTTAPAAETPAKGFSPGFAALGLEAASRGATAVTLLEQDPKLVQTLRQTVQKLQAGLVELVKPPGMQAPQAKTANAARRPTRAPAVEKSVVQRLIAKIKDA